MIEALAARLVRVLRLLLAVLLLLRRVVGSYPPCPTHHFALAQSQTFDVDVCVPSLLPPSFLHFDGRPLVVRSGLGGACVGCDDGGSC